MLISDEQQFVLPDVMPTMEEIVDLCLYVVNLPLGIEDFYQNEIFQMTRTILYEIELGAAIEQIIPIYFRIIMIVTRLADHPNN